jgi:hypothetical protein
MSEPRGSAFVAGGGLCERPNEPCQDEASPGRTVCGTPSGGGRLDAFDDRHPVGLELANRLCVPGGFADKPGPDGQEDGQPGRVWAPAVPSTRVMRPRPPQDPLTCSVVELKRFG